MADEYYTVEGVRYVAGVYHADVGGSLMGDNVVILCTGQVVVFESGRRVHILARYGIALEDATCEACRSDPMFDLYILERTEL